MDSASDLSPLTKFVEKANKTMDDHHPKWREYLSTEKGETLCIPECLDLGTNRYRLSPHLDASLTEKDRESRRANITGDNGEDEFLRTFRQLKVGGILLGGFDSKIFFKKLNNRTIPNKGPQQKPDFIFFHNRIGIMIFEVKGATGNQEFPKESFENAIKQIEIRKKWMPEIFKIICSEKFELKDIHYAICFPFFGFNKDVLNRIPHRCSFISKLNESSLENSMADVVTHHFKTSIVCHNMQKFYDLTAVMIYGSRSVVELSHAVDALKLYQALDSQTYLGDAKWTTKEERKIARNKVFNDLNEETSFFLNKEQTQALEWHESNNNASNVQIITGLPGTGKTLIIMLQALRASKKNKPGKVIISTPYSPSMAKIKKFCDNNKNEGTRREIVYVDKQRDIFFHGVAADHDDIFFDEQTINETIFIFLQGRLNVKGKTTMGITGSWDPLSALDISEEILFYHGLKRNQVFDLRIVVRGTQHIVNRWTKYYPENIRKSMGHKIVGPSVEKFNYETSAQCLARVYYIVKCFLGLEISKNARTTKPQHLAILTQHGEFVIKVLRVMGINCGTLAEQIEDPSLIGIGTTDVSNSLEWPEVIVLSLVPICNEWQNVLFYSRAMVKLFIIKLDYSALFLSSDRQFSEIFKTNRNLSEVIQLGLKIAESSKSKTIGNDEADRSIQSAIKEGKINLNKLETFEKNRIDSQLCMVILQHDYLVKEIKRMPILGNCSSMIDCFKKFVRSPFLCHYFLQTDPGKNFFSRWAHDKMGFYFFPNIPKIFSRIWEKYCDSAEQEDRTKEISNLLHRLKIIWTCIEFVRIMERYASLEYVISLSCIIFLRFIPKNLPIKDLTKDNWGKYYSAIRESIGALFSLRNHKENSAYLHGFSVLILSRILRQLDKKRNPMGVFIDDELELSYPFNNNLLDVKEMHEILKSAKKQKLMSKGFEAISFILTGSLLVITVHVLLG